MKLIRLITLSTFSLGLGACAAKGAGAPADGAAAGAAAPTAAAANGEVDLSDPTGDDDGPGTYKYPTDAVYKSGSFDLVGLKVVPSGDQIEFRVTVNSRIEDPWDSKAWGGNGFSVQMAMIHIDQDHTAGSGSTKGLPGTNVRFADNEAWDRVVVISPQGPTRVNSEIDSKAADLKDKIIVPRITRASGKTLIAVVGLDQLGAAPKAGWGYNVLMQSNEGFPDKTDLLTRKVNEFEGQHRFGGGTDFDNDPHVIDVFAGAAKGGADESGAQHELLSKYNKQTQEPKAEDLALIPLIYR